MNQLSYPIGVFELPASVSPERREHWKHDIAELPSLLRSSLDGHHDDALDRSPRQGAWTVRQLVHHLADAHIHASAAFRLALAQRDPPLLALPEKLLAVFPDAKNSDLEASLRLLDGLHARWSSLLHAMKDSDFTRPLRWPKAPFETTEGALGYYAWHGRHHVTQIEIALYQRSVSSVRAVEPLGLPGW